MAQNLQRSVIFLNVNNKWKNELYAYFHSKTNYTILLKKELSSSTVEHDFNTILFQKPK